MTSTIITPTERPAIEHQLRTGRVGIVPQVQLEVRDVDDRTRRVEGRAVPYNVEIDLGWYIEMIKPGCFTKSIRESARDLPLLLFHDSRSLDAIVGVAESWDERADGLHGVWRLDDSDDGRRAAEKLDSGSLSFLSVGFQPKSGDAGSEFVWDDDDVLHVLRKEARLLETSLTPTPAYGDAVVTKVRHAPIGNRNSTRRLEAAREWLEQARAVG